MENIEDYLKQKRELLDSYLKVQVESLGIGKIVEAIKYSVLSGGKRLRPILLFSLGDVLEIKDDLLPFASSLEILHNASLIHDDLPIMDDDDYRRGKLTVHKKFGSAIALLAGDAMVSFAYDLILKSDYFSEKKNRLMSIISKIWGVLGICGGQALEVEVEEGKSVEPFEIFRRKTGALFGAIFEGAGVLKEMAPEQTQKFYLIGENIGVVYQINDDLDDTDEKSYNSMSFYSREELLAKKRDIIEKTLKMVHNYKLLKFPFKEILSFIWREENV